MAIGSSKVNEPVKNGNFWLATIGLGVTLIGYGVQGIAEREVFRAKLLQLTQAGDDRETRLRKVEQAFESLTATQQETNHRLQRIETKLDNSK